ncbi:MAG: hypothetical protein V1865_02665 [bacterium]
MKTKQKNSKGFSMLEIVIMVALVAIAFVGIVKIMNKTTQLRYLTRNDFIAQGLAKEGIELAEQIRNDNIENINPFWTNFFLLEPSDDDDRIIRLDYNGAPSILVVTGADDALATLKFDNTNYYQYSTGTDSIFGRALTLTYQYDASTPTAYMEVKSDVYWEYKGDGHTFTVETRLYDTN